MGGPSGRQSSYLRGAFLSYILLWVLNFFIHLLKLEGAAILLPILFVLLPVFIQKDIHLRFVLKDFLLGFVVSLIIIGSAAVFIALTTLSGEVTVRKIQLPSLDILIYQLFGVAFAEEVFFRGFIQEQMTKRFSSLSGEVTVGGGVTVVVLTSLLFGLMHLPSLFFYGNLLAPLTFFPSLIMGYLYLRTRNILPSIIFHYLANLFIYSISL